MVLKFAENWVTDVHATWDGRSEPKFLLLSMHFIANWGSAQGIGFYFRILLYAVSDSVKLIDLGVHWVSCLIRSIEAVSSRLEFFWLVLRSVLGVFTVAGLRVLFEVSKGLFTKGKFESEKCWNTAPMWPLRNSKSTENYGNNCRTETHPNIPSFTPMPSNSDIESGLRSRFPLEFI